MSLAADNVFHIRRLLGKPAQYKHCPIDLRTILKHYLLLYEFLLVIVIKVIDLTLRALDRSQ